MPKQKRRHWNSVESRLHFARPYVDGFEKWLQNHGYTPSTIEEQVRLLAGWTNWMHAAGFGLDNILDGLAASAAVFRGKKSIRAYGGAGRLFIRYLQDQGTLPRSVPPPSPAEQWPIFGAFRAWARQHRGIAHSTLDLWQRPIIDLLKSLGEDPKTYTAEALRVFMLERAKRYKVGRLKTYAVAIRGFLRFLVATGRCPAGREYALPPIANWQLASVPRYLVAEDVERAIAACDGERRLRAGPLCSCSPAWGYGRVRLPISRSPILTGETVGLPSVENRSGRSGSRSPRRLATRSSPTSNRSGPAFALRGCSSPSLRRFAR